MKSSIKAFGIALAILFAANSAFAQSSARLIVYRKGSPYGALAKYQVNVDNKNVGTLKGSSVYETTLTPGEHTIGPKQEHRRIKINAESGQTYVVKYKTRIGIFGARPHLKKVSFDQAKKDSKYFAMHAKA